MRVSFASAVLLASCGNAFPHTHLHTRRDSPALRVASADYLCDVKSTNTDTVRDLGYVGQIAGKTVHTYGDTLAGPGASFYMTSDSSAVGGSNPCRIFDAALENGDHPAQFVPIMAKYGEVNTVDAMGITNIVSTGPDTGMLFFLKNHRPMGGDQYIVGAGIADVKMSGDVPSATRTSNFWWNTRAGEPNYGDVTAYGGKKFIWGLGHGGNGQYCYLTRARQGNYHDLSAWQYFDGSTGKWSHNRLYNPTPDQALKWNDEEGAVWGVGQGQMIWSNYFNKIMFVYAQSWAGTDGKTAILARTADRPIGPWSAATTLFSVAPDTEGGLVYSPIPNPYFDDSGKTLVVTVTNSPNTIQAHRVTFA